MIKTIINKHNINVQVLLTEHRRYAKQCILMYPLNHTERVLDNYLQTNYKIPLRAACFLIWKNCAFYKNNNNVDIILTDKKLNKLYQIITFGVGNIKGSQILTCAFR